MPDETLPEIWVRAHPFGSATEKDAHGEFFDAETEFYDDLLPAVPVNYYHAFTPEGKPSDKPVAIGIAAERQYKNPLTGEADGRWDKIKFFDNVSLDIKTRIQNAIEAGTLRSSPSTVPDYHRVRDDGKITHWLSGNLAVFDASGNRQPANPRAIGIAEMKALYKAANLEFPNLTGVTMAQQKENWVKQAIHTLKALFDTMPQTAEAETADQENMAQWDEIFGKDETEVVAKLETKTEAEPAVPQEENDMADEKQLQELRETYDNQMKAMLANNSKIQRELDETKLNTWFDEQLRAGKVMPAEKPDIVGMALQLKQDDDAAHPTMKSTDGQVTLRLDAFKKTIEARPSRLGGDNQLKAAGFDTPQGADAPPSAERVNKLLKMTPLGEQALKDKNGNGN